ncbi:hypothetical protein ACFYZJ_31190 [Streptomyces sp. NPDC001848]
MLVPPLLEPMLARAMDALPALTALSGGVLHKPKYAGSPDT